MRILFILKELTLVRHFDAVLDHLAAAGHDITLGVTDLDLDAALPESLARHPKCRLVPAPTSRDDGLKAAASIVRLARDYLRYHEPSLWRADANRRRALSRLLERVSGGTRALPAAGGAIDAPFSDVEADVVRTVFEQVETLIPSSKAHERFIKAHRPDVVLLTPLVTIGGRQAEFVKAARALEIPTALLVFSWDNLSNKGILHVRPDRIFVWNELQRREAIELHGAPPSSVVAVGAPRFDDFYRMSPSTDRERFCQSFGLDPTLPLIVYVASTPHVIPDEPAFVERWIAAIRAAAGPVRSAQILIRPHPRFKTDWVSHVRFGALCRAPPSPDLPGVGLMLAKSVTSEQSLFDALYHAGAVVGLNTSAELEAGILGKPVYTIDVPDVAPGQGGSLHFYYLLQSQQGFVHEAVTLEEHVAQLGEGLDGRFDRERQSDFITSFLRPRGADVPVVPALAEEIRAFAAASGPRGMKRLMRAATNGWAASGQGVSLLSEATRRQLAGVWHRLPLASRRLRQREEHKRANAARKERLRAERRSGT